MTHDPIQPYDAYRLQGMIDHGYSLPRLIRELARLQEEFPDLGIEDLWEEWKQGFGFGGDIWESYDGWMSNEWEKEQATDGEIKEIMERTEEALSFPNASVIVLTKHGANDWDVYFPDLDSSVRGTKQNILDEIKDLMDWNDNKGGNTHEMVRRKAVCYQDR